MSQDDAERTPTATGSNLFARWFKPAGRRRWLLLGAGVAIAAAAVAFLLTRGNGSGGIVTAPVTRGDVERTVLATGVLEPSRLVSVGAQVSGQLRRLYVTLGQQVKAGDQIAEIDSTTQQNSVSTAEAELANTQAQRTASAAALLRAEAVFKRQQELLAADAVSRADYETAEADLASSRADLASLDAQIRQARLELSTAQANLGYTRIVAPMDGTIVAIVTEEGQTVNANQSAPTIVKLAQLGTMTVSAEISEADVAKVSAGADVYFTTLGDTGTRREATLRAIEPAPEEIETSDSISSTDSAIYYNGLFDVDNADDVLRTGMTAQVTIVLERAADALLVPSSALGQALQGDTYMVPVLDADGRPVPRRVRIGINNGTQAQVLDGLAEGDQVVVAQAGDGTAASTGSSTSRPPGGMMMGPPPGGGGPR